MPSTVVFQPYWSWFSMVFYIVLGMMAVWALQQVYVEKWINERESSAYADIRIFIVVVIWTFFATFRLVASGIGGTDALGYIGIFDNCLDPVYVQNIGAKSSDVVFVWINQIIRSCTSDYHVYFAIVYGFMAWASLSFVKMYMPKQISFAPFILAIFLYWRGFNTLRSNLAIAFLLVALMAMAEKKWIQTIIITLLAAFVHKVAMMYALIIPFCWFFRERQLRIYHIAAVIIGLSLFAGVFRNWFILYIGEQEAEAVYGAYASHTIETSFLDNYWKIAFEQLVLGAAMIIYNRRIQSIVEDYSDESYAWRMRVLWMACAFDLIMLPIAYILYVWRAYEILYMPRIVMWALILGFLLEDKSKSSKLVLNIGLLIIFVGWLIFRFYKMYASSSLMPYFFESPFDGASRNILFM